MKTSIEVIKHFNSLTRERAKKIDRSLPHSTYFQNTDEYRIEAWFSYTADKIFCSIESIGTKFEYVWDNGVLCFLDDNTLLKSIELKEYIADLDNPAQPELDLLFMVYPEVGEILNKLNLAVEIANASSMVTAKMIGN